MPTFPDKHKQNWTVELTVGRVEKIRDACKVDLLDVDFRVVLQLRDDPILLARVLWCLCADEASKLSIEPDKFFDRFDGDSFAAATEALLEALLNFIPPAKRSLLQSLWSTQTKAEAESMKRAMERMPGLAERIATATDMAIEKELTEALKRFDSSTSSEVT